MASLHHVFDEPNACSTGNCPIEAWFKQKKDEHIIALENELNHAHAQILSLEEELEEARATIRRLIEGEQTEWSA